MADDPYGDIMAEEMVNSERQLSRGLPPKQVSKLFRTSLAGSTINNNNNNNDNSNDAAAGVSLTQRNGHLRRLYLKEKLRRAVLSMHKPKQEEHQQHQQHQQQRQTEQVESSADSKDASDSTLEQELRQQIQQESQTEALQGKVKEVTTMLEQAFGKHFTPTTTGGYPLEVRIQNLSYSAMRRNNNNHDDGDAAGNIQTVYNTSFLFKMNRYLRKVTRCQARQRKTLPSSSGEPFYMLHDINLVIQPGKQYLILGPPASGKTSLLKAIAGLIPTPTPKDPETLQGTIWYNGKTLKVCFVFLFACCHSPKKEKDSQSKSFAFENA